MTRPLMGDPYLFTDGEQAETQHWFDTALACKYIAEDVHKNLMNQCVEIGQILGKMMANPEQFCNRYAYGEDVKR